MVTTEYLGGLIGALLALVLKYAPVLKDRFYDLEPDKKRLVVVLLCVALGAGLGLMKPYNGEYGLAVWDLFFSVLQVLVGSQVVHRVLPKG